MEEYGTYEGNRGTNQRCPPGWGETNFIDLRRAKTDFDDRGGRSMKRCTPRNVVKQRLLMGLLAANVYLVVLAQPAFPGDSQPAHSEQTELAAAVPGSTSGMIIHIDPQTGAILKGPAPGAVPLQLSPAVQNTLSTSHQGLAEVPSPFHGGGVKVDLQGRFRSPSFATIDSNGNVRILHLDEIPGSDDNK
jgi:hypothetical protein